MFRALRFPVAFLLPLAILLALASTPVLAAVALDQAQEVVDELFCAQPHDGSACYHGGAQTFTAGESGELVAVELAFARQAFTTTASDLVVEIHADAPGGALLATSSPIPADTIPIDPDLGWILVQFPTPAALVAGEVYAIVIPIEPLSPTTDPAWGWGKSASDEYGGGSAWGGSSGFGWDAYVNGSDMAFRTYVGDGFPPVCDLALAVDGGELVDGTLEVEAGQVVEVYGFDYPPLSEVTIALVPAEGEPEIAADMTDVVGSFAGELEFAAADAGGWQVVAHPSADPEACRDQVDILVLAASGPTPSPSPTPAASPTATPGTGGLPNTAIEAPAPGPSPDALATLALVLVAVTGAIARRTVVQRIR